MFPVSVSRKLYEKNPFDLLPEKLHPATKWDKLSPADRVFGWVSQDADTGDNPAYRSHVRIGPVECKTEDAIVREPKTLAILGQPKPAQGRFYLGKAKGTQQQNGLSKEKAGYTRNNRIRGPKVYPHHQQGVSDENAYTQEKSSQNRTIEGYVRAEAVFEFDLNVTNLSKFELGALLWLLSLPEKHFMRLGLGKPLGFGNVRAEIIPADTIIADGEKWIEHIGTAGQPNSCDYRSFIDQFAQTMQATNPDVLKGFQTAASGFAELNIHYPLLPNQTANGGQHFNWFTQNEKGQKYTLPDVANPSLPRNPVNS